MTVPPIGETKRVVGAVLAGGASRRMGQDKSTLVIPGEPAETFGARAVRVLASVSDEVIVLGHGRGVDPALPRLEDAVPDAGPAGGLLALLESGRGGVYVVLPVDMPLVDSALLTELLAALDATPDASAATFTLEGRREPLPVVLRASARPRVAAALARGERGLGRILDDLGSLQVPSREPVLLQNINTSEDFRTISGERSHR